MDERQTAPAPPEEAGGQGAREPVRPATPWWSNTVNIAARVESRGISGEIQISEATRALLPPKFVCEDRGEIPVKGKGRMRVFLVKGLRGPLPRLAGIVPRSSDHGSRSRSASRRVAVGDGPQGRTPV